MMRQARLFAALVLAALLSLAIGERAASQVGVSPPAAGTPTMLLHAAPDSGYVYLSWNEIPEIRSYRVEWRPLRGGPWQSENVTGPAYHKSVVGLENNVAYEFRVLAAVGGSGASFISPIVRATPIVRTECLISESFSCTLAGAREFLSISPGGPPFRCDGIAFTELTPDTPNCAYVSGERLYGFDRFLSNTFRDPAVPSLDVVRAAGRRAIWGANDPFNSPELFTYSVLPLQVLDPESFSDFVRADSYIIRLTPQVSSRFTVYTPRSPIPGQYMVYVEGHGLTGKTAASDFLGWYLLRGWTVAAMDMVLEGTNRIDSKFPVDGHDAFRFYPPTQARPFDVFLLPVKIVIDQLLQDSPVANPNLVLAGRSGGGWTACMYGALDERVTVAINISGCWPRSIALDPAVLNTPAVLHFDYLQPHIFDEVSMLEYIISAGTRGNLHFYSVNDPSVKLSESSPYIQYLRRIGVTENANPATRNRTRVQIGVQRIHGLDLLAYDVMGNFLRDLGLPVTVLPAPPVEGP